MRRMEKVNKIILHCSASDELKDNTLEAIKRLHTADKDNETVIWKGKQVFGMGFEDIGYHYFIDAYGELWYGREVMYQGAHCKGENHDSIGICLAGEKEFSLNQYRTLFKLLDKLYVSHNINKGDVFGHRVFNKNKTCPNFRVDI